MPVSLQCDGFSLSSEEVDRLWQETIVYRGFSDDVAAVRCVDEQEISRLNKEYRGKDAATNILTFSYDGEHDVALCGVVAEREAQERGIDIKEYVALLLVHAFLHVTGLDHERSREEAKKMSESERLILDRAGFALNSL